MKFPVPFPPYPQAWEYMLKGHGAWRLYSGPARRISSSRLGTITGLLAIVPCYTHLSILNFDRYPGQSGQSEGVSHE